MKRSHPLPSLIFAVFLLAVLAQSSGAQRPSQPATGSAKSEIACSASGSNKANFNGFLSAFIKDGQVRQAYTPSKVDVRTLDLQLADRQDMYTRAVVPQETILSALFDTALAAEREVQVASVKSQGAVVSFVYPQHLEDKDTLIFEKTQRCWRLKTVFRDPLPFPSVLPNKSAQKAERCSKKAAKREEVLESEEDGNLDRALYGYLCAAQNGSDTGAMVAVDLASRDQSRRLPSHYVETLVMRSGNNKEKAEYYCGTSEFIVPAFKEVSPWIQYCVAVKIDL